ncbi:MAG: ABC transporter ATP-binding protein [Tidjanibacter sp.]|nr:ABC transporter ATP-binding protein [Tidjanibacter sp.]
MITVRDIHKSFGSLEVLRGVSFDIERGSVVSIVGASGAGKTTLLQIMGTLSRADRGEVLIDGVATEKLNDNDLSIFRNRRIGFVFQAHNLLPEFTALENVCLPGFIAGRDKEEVEAQAVELLRGLDLSERALHKPAQMSGGEQQRVAVARALINQPAVLLADEPSGNLDTHNRRELHRLFFDLRERTGQTVVIVTHDEELASSTDRTLRLVDGLLVNE